MYDDGRTSIQKSRICKYMSITSFQQNIIDLMFFFPFFFKFKCNDSKENQFQESIDEVNKNIEKVENDIKKNDVGWRI